MRTGYSSPDNVLGLYLKEIAKTPLLSTSEEQELSLRVAQGDFSAREHMVKANLRLVVNIARGFKGLGLSLEDLIEEGNLGLLRAVEGYDGSLGTRFSTYATYWIKQSIRAALIKGGKQVRLPGYMVSLISKWNHAVKILTERLGRAPEPQEVAHTLYLSEKKMNYVLQALAVSELQRSSDHDGANAEDEILVLASLFDDEAMTPDQEVASAEMAELIKQALATRDEREQTVIRMRFGLDCSPLTLREVGEKLGLTRERVRQVEQQALRALAAEFTIGVRSGITPSTRRKAKKGDATKEKPKRKRQDDTLDNLRAIVQESLRNTPASKASRAHRASERSQAAKRLRRRCIDPVTCSSKQTTPGEEEFARCATERRNRQGRQLLPHEVIQLAVSLGYVRQDPAPPDDAGTASLSDEFAKALDSYKQSSGRQFPVWSEVLEVLQGLGYAKSS